MKNKNKIIILIVVVLIIGALYFLYQPIKNQKERLSPTQKPNVEEIVRLFSPQPYDLTSGHLTIKGEVRGNWFFEGSAPYYIVSAEFSTIASGIIHAQEDWMTDDFVPFVEEIDFIPQGEKGYLVLKNDNPSGMAEKDLYYSVPLKFQQPQTMTVKAFFNNNQFDPEYSCTAVFPVERKIVKTSAVARAALEELLKGPTDEEKEEGFFTSINPDVKIQSLKIENGTAYVDFNEQLEFQVGGSCRVSAIRAQITETLKQFPSINNIIISINGRTEDILQP
ncbi:MAG: GerMN domain-containing protein [Candidatus Pacebacteria bacterium]|nr:GerMN domain-containing protein [Candidatus Paceibacterota bacterium]